jgi:hypothetical protein
MKWTEQAIGRLDQLSPDPDGAEGDDGQYVPHMLRLVASDSADSDGKLPGKTCYGNLERDSCRMLLLGK